MPQLYPQPVSSTQGVTVRAGAGLYGGGLVALGQATTLSTETTRQQYPTSPAADGMTGSFTILGPVPDGYVDVFSGGVFQPLSAYTLSGNQIFFQTPPASGADVVAVFATPVDTRQQYTLSPAADGVTTSFTFPTDLPGAVYVDVYSSAGSLLQFGVDYTINFISGNWTVVFTTAPASGNTPLAVFSPNIPDDRMQYALSPAADGAATRFRIVGGAPDTTVDVFAAGLFQNSTQVVLNIVAGEWVIDFTAAPAIGTLLLAVF